MGRKEVVSVSMKGNCGCVKSRCGVAVFVRLFHTALCLSITATLLWKDTALKTSLVDMEAPVYGGMYLGLLALSIILYYAACLTDPGFVSKVKYKKKQHEQSENQGTDSEFSEEDIEMGHMDSQPLDSQPLDRRNRYRYRYCDYCEIQPPLRSKHCEDCKLCVRKYDHHCPWLETCVGERNHKYFWLFLLVMSVIIIWTFIIVWESFVTKKTWSEWFHSNLVLFLDTVVLVLSGPVVVGLLVFHTYLMTNGLSTWEAASRERITYLKYLDDEYNPFDEGCIKNVYNFMCVFKIRKWESLYAQKAKFKDSDI